MSEQACYMIKPSGEFRILVPPTRLVEVVTEILMRKLASQVIVGSVHHSDDLKTVNSIVIGFAEGEPSNRSGMQTFLRKKDIPCVEGS